MNLNQITLPAINIKESVSFYTQTGFTQIVDAEHYARFECPVSTSTFSIHHVESIVENSVVVVYFEEENLASKVKQLQDIGFVFFQQPVKCLNCDIQKKIKFTCCYNIQW